MDYIQTDCFDRSHSLPMHFALHDSRWSHTAVYLISRAFCTTQTVSFGLDLNMLKIPASSVSDEVKHLQNMPSCLAVFYVKYVNINIKHVQIITLSLYVSFHITYVGDCILHSRAFENSTFMPAHTLASHPAPSVASSGTSHTLRRPHKYIEWYGHTLHACFAHELSATMLNI